MTSDEQRRLAEGYRRCARITRQFGTTYFWGAALLAPERRHHVHAVYALCRLADDIVDDQAAIDANQPERVSAELFAFADRFRRALDAGDAGDTVLDDPVLAAVAHTVRETHIDRECFDRFFAAMAMDLTVGSYRTFSDLTGYMDGSAAVIGEMMLPVLQPLTAAAREPARALGFAFQLTNFLRDVGEDLDRGRVYLPQEELDAFGIDLSQGRPVINDRWRAFLSFQIARNRDLYEAADVGIPMLPSRSARCVIAARALYSQILDRIEAADYDIFGRRARVPTAHKMVTATRIMFSRRRNLRAAAAPF